MQLQCQLKSVKNSTLPKIGQKKEDSSLLILDIPGTKSASAGRSFDTVCEEKKASLTYLYSILGMVHLTL